MYLKMAAPIPFQNVQARAQLLQFGIVYTFRRIKRVTLGKSWANEGRGTKKLCDVNIEFVKRVTTPEDLMGYVKQSGFFDLTDWLEAIDKFHPCMQTFTGFLYKVTKR